MLIYIFRSLFTNIFIFCLIYSVLVIYLYVLREIANFSYNCFKFEQRVIKQL